MKSFFLKRSFKTTLLVLLALLCLAFIINEARGNGDFKVFLEAAKLMASKGDIYNTWFDRGNSAAGLYFYSPLFALLLIPFTYLPSFVPNLIWLLMNVYFLYRIWQLLTKYLDLQYFDAKSKNLFLSLTILFTFRFIHLNFGQIQMTIFLLWSMIESIHSFKNKRNIKGAALLALAINIKILPIVLIPYLIYRKQLKPVLFTLAFFILYLMLPVIFIGFEYHKVLLVEWWKQVNPLHREQLVETIIGIHSLTALIPSLFHETNSAIDLQRHIVHLDLKYVTLILNSVRAILVLFTIFFLRTFPFKAARSKMHEFWELSYIILLIPLIFPHQHKYAFVLILPAVAYIIYFFIYLYNFDRQEFTKRKWKVSMVLMLIVFILTTLTTDGIIGRSLCNITQHYMTITYGAIILLIVLAKCNPWYIENVKISVDPKA